MIARSFKVDPKREPLRLLLRKLQGAGIKVGFNGKVRWYRRDWKKGKPVVVVHEFSTFKEAIRALEHAYDSVFERSREHRWLWKQLKKFNQWLRQQDLEGEEKRDEALQKLTELAALVSGVRSPHLVDVREHMIAERLPVRNLRELLEDKNWGAACCKVALLLNPGASREIQRILKIAPALLYKRELLGKVWAHLTWLGGRLRGETIELAKRYDACLEAGYELGQFRIELNELIKLFPSKVDHRLNKARGNLDGVRRALARAKQPPQSAKRELKKAQFNLRNFVNWLQLADSREGMTPEKRRFFVGVA